MSLRTLGLGNVYNIEGKEAPGALEAALMAGDRAPSKRKVPLAPDASEERKEIDLDLTLDGIVLEDVMSDVDVSDGELEPKNLAISADMEDCEGDEEYMDEGDSYSEGSQEEGDE